MNMKILLRNKKGMSIPIVITITIVFAIAIYSVQFYTAQTARNIHRSVNLKKAEYIAEAGLNRTAAFIRARNFGSRIYKNVAGFSFGYTNRYSETYYDGKYTVIIIDIPAIIKNFGVDFKVAEYQGIFLWSLGTYRDVTRIILARYIPMHEPLRVFNYKKAINEMEEFEYTNLEVN